MTATKAFHVIIVGGGIGGLTLAQGLKKNGISCAVYEKDISRADRLQGYRIVFPFLEVPLLILESARLWLSWVKDMSSGRYI
jgi:2-polyprenyl-6-methoxyphenol hydroxylase-like FAD-dependent oxidoreductase